VVVCYLTHLPGGVTVGGEEVCN